MNLSSKFLAFCKPHLDRWMLTFQRDNGIGLEDWKQLQSDYKKVYGKDYERKN